MVDVASYGGSRQVWDATSGSSMVYANWSLGSEIKRERVLVCCKRLVYRGSMKMKNRTSNGHIYAYCFRTAMCGGGTSYDVYFRKQDKPSHPLHGGHIYATTICRDGGEYFSTVDAIDPRSRWEMDCGMSKYEAHKVLESKANRLAVRIAKRAYPELIGQRELPFLWAVWNKPSAVVKVAVKLSLPD